MNTSANAVSLTSRIIRKTWWLALVPAIYALYLGFVSIVLLLGQNTIVTLEDDPFLDLSLAMAPNNAEANAAKAGFIRRRALLPDNPDPKGDLQIALDHWLKAIEGRPLWPYYQLGALDSEYLLSSPPEVLQKRIDHIITTTPNERGIDFRLLEIMILSWDVISDQQRLWVNNRLLISKDKTLQYVLEKIEQASKDNPRLCAELPWSVVQPICSKS